jgi:Glycosyltransferase (GlcNAc)
MDRIFIQIAAYRDPELLPTIRDCIKRADHPERLDFCIAWQHNKDDEWDTLEEFHTHPNFNIIDLDSSQGLGTCWARHLLNTQYAGQKYTLQLDSHHRFVKGWDTKCVGMLDKLRSSGYDKPLLSSYIASYNPRNDPQERVKEVWKLNFDRFTPEGVVFMLPAAIDQTVLDTHDGPFPTRFFSAHFVFTLGSFVEEVPYDPNLYFHGEEISMAVRAYTSGYDLFVPNQIIAWHEYTRQGRIRHWDENKRWEELNKRSLKRVKILLGVDGDYDSNEYFGPYGLGTVRTQKDYEDYAGIRFKDRAIQDYTLKNFDPPNPIYQTVEKQEESYKSIFRHCLDIWKGSVSRTDYDFWAVIFEDDDGNEMYREDAFEDEIRDLLSTESDWVNLWRQFETKKIPATAIVWPYSRERGWEERIEIRIPRL